MAKESARLDSYFANVSARRRGVGNWRIYAAATGSAMAMATNASAGVIYFNQAITAGPEPNAARSSEVRHSQSIALKSAMGESIGIGFKVGVLQNFSASGHLFGAAFLQGVGGNFSVLFSTSGRLRKLAFGANISTAPGGWESSAPLAFQNGTENAISFATGWAANSTGIAGFRFSTTNHVLDYGWVRFSYTLGTNGLANSITATDWAYESTGAPVTAGEVPSSTPDPSTSALAILAAGAAGVAALRRRRHEFNQ